MLFVDHWLLSSNLMFSKHSFTNYIKVSNSSGWSFVRPALGPNCLHANVIRKTTLEVKVLSSEYFRFLFSFIIFALPFSVCRIPLHFQSSFVFIFSLFPTN